MLLFSAETPPITSPLIQIVIEEKIEEPTPVEYTLEEKIKLNINQCNEETHWIRADNAECLAKPLRTAQTTTPAQNPAKSTVNASQTASSGLNGYVLNSCTGWVATHRYVPAGWGNATSWKANAIKAGWTVSSTPVVGAIGWAPGHVVFIETVNGDGTVTLSERNYDYKGSIRTITVPSSKYTYIY